MTRIDVIFLGIQEKLWDIKWDLGGTKSKKTGKVS